VSLSILALVLISVTVAVMWLRGVMWLIPADTRGSRMLWVDTADGRRLEISFRPALEKRFKEPVLLAHGLANTHHFFEAPGGLARFLSAAGFDCYSVNFRGAQEAFSIEPQHISFDDHVFIDAPALVAAILRHSGASRLHWVGHSLGGLIGAACLAQTAAPHSVRAHFRSLCTIGSPVFLRLDAHSAVLLRLGQLLAATGSIPAHWALRFIAPFAGIRVKLPQFSTNLDNVKQSLRGYLCAHAFAPIWRGVLQQLFDWLTHGVFRSADQTIDFRAALSRDSLSMLVIGGSIDGLCRPEAARAHFDALQTPDKTLMIFGRAHGHSVDYGHGDLCLGERSTQDVFEPLAKWLTQRSVVRESTRNLSPHASIEPSSIG
jgi:pimeloyl-ACP methyl ester carboxylesterase